MKQILSLANGAVTLTEDSGKFTLALNASIGGGDAAGVVKGEGAIVLDGMMGLKLGEALLNSHLPPTMLPLAQVVEGVANQAAAALE